MGFYCITKPRLHFFKAIFQFKTTKNYLFLSSDLEKLWIIDYEYASINHAAYDLANHFNEYAGKMTLCEEMYFLH